MSGFRVETARETGAIPDFDKLFDRPIIILAAPRSGSTLLFETLAEARDVWTVGGESHRIIEGVKALSVNAGHVDSNRLTAMHASIPIIRFMRRRFARLLRDRDGRKFFDHPAARRLRFLEKTPKNALRLPFMEQVFPGALYIFLFRDVRANLSSMMEAWRSGRWVTYPRLQGWQGPPWSLLLPPGWQDMRGKSLQEICAFQWCSANQTVMEDLKQIPRNRWTSVAYQELLDEPLKALESLCEFAGLEIDERLRQRLRRPLPLSRYTHTQPSADKWRKNEGEIESVLDLVAGTEKQLELLGYHRRN